MEIITLFMSPGSSTRKTCLGNGTGQGINGEWRWRTGGSAGEPGGASHFITDYCFTGAMGNGEWRKIPASCLAGQGTSGSVHLGSANAPSPAME